MAQPAIVASPEPGTYYIAGNTWAVGGAGAGAARVVAAATAAAAGTLMRGWAAANQNRHLAPPPPQASSQSCACSSSLLYVAPAGWVPLHTADSCWGRGTAASRDASAAPLTRTRARARTTPGQVGSRYTLLKLLGEGSFSQVALARDRDTGELVRQKSKGLLLAFHGWGSIQYASAVAGGGR